MCLKRVFFKVNNISARARGFSSYIFHIFKTKMFFQFFDLSSSFSKMYDLVQLSYPLVRIFGTLFNRNTAKLNLTNRTFNQQTDFFFNSRKTKTYIFDFYYESGCISVFVFWKWFTKVKKPRFEILIHWHYNKYSLCT